ncbi:MAG: FAD binding domain-containing protein [Ardenticatenaceae bacterium]|nr:FAD binding domain-containing protein [Ardenticatenaceae bacterium]
MNDIAELGALARLEPDGLHVGAMVRQSNLERSQIIAATLPLLHETMPHIAHPQIRNRGTLGGSLAHADPAAELTYRHYHRGTGSPVPFAAGKRRTLDQS